MAPGRAAGRRWSGRGVVSSHVVRPLVWRASRVVTEVTLLGGLYLLYRTGRLAVTGELAEAFRNASVIRQLERWLHLPSEASFQALFDSAPLLLGAANVYSVSVHFPLTIVFLVWGFLRRSVAEYEWARNLICLLYTSPSPR